MALWLFKEEPDHYSYADLERDGSALWDGVSNALAQKHLRAVAVGDRVFLYQTGKEKAVVGVMAVTAGPAPSPADATGKLVSAVSPSKLVAVTVSPVFRLAKPVTLAAIKADGRFAGWELVRMPRQSVLPVSAEQWKMIEEIGGG